MKPRPWAVASGSMREGERSYSGRGGGKTFDRAYISRDEFEVFERNVEGSFRRLGSDLDRIATKIDAMAKPPTMMILGLLSLSVALVGGIGTLAMQPFLRDLARIEATQGTTQETLQNIQASRWTREDHERFEDRIDQRHDALRARVLEVERGIIRVEPPK